MAELTAKELKDILAEQARQNAENLRVVIEEIKKPTQLEQKKIDDDAKAILTANEMRKDTSAGVLQQMKDKATWQRVHTHKHRDGNSHCVHIQEKNNATGYILCQGCQARVRPDGTAEQRKLDPNAVYDTRLYNELFQTLPSLEMFQ